MINKPMTYKDIKTVFYKGRPFAAAITFNITRAQEAYWLRSDLEYDMQQYRKILDSILLAYEDKYKCLISMSSIVWKWQNENKAVSFGYSLL